MSSTSFAILQVDPHTAGHIEAVLIAAGYGDRCVGGTVCLNDLGIEGHVHAPPSKETQRLDWMIAMYDDATYDKSNALHRAHNRGLEGREAINAAMLECS